MGILFNEGINFNSIISCMITVIAIITFYDKSVKLEEKFQIGENVFLHINPENLGQFFVENATEPDKRMVFEISAMILMGSIIIQYLL